MKTESEKITREKRINSRLTSAPLNWTVIPWKQGMDTSILDAHAVEEYPTQTGPADYALFVKGQLLGIIEAKKLSVGVYAAIEQAKRYAKGVNNTVGQSSRTSVTGATRPENWDYGNRPWTISTGLKSALPLHPLLTRWPCSMRSSILTLRMKLWKMAGWWTMMR